MAVQSPDSPRWAQRLQTCAIRGNSRTRWEQLKLLRILERVIKVEDRFLPLFTDDDVHVGLYRGARHVLRVNDPSPIVCPRRVRFSRHHGHSERSKQQALCDLLQRLLRGRLIVPSSSEWAASANMIPRGPGKWELCFDYDWLNQALLDPEEDQSHGRPEEDYSLSCCWSILGVHRGSHQIALHPETRHVTSFKTPMGQYEWTTLPSSIKGADQALRTALTNTLTGLERCTVLRGQCILVHSQSVNEHLVDLAQVIDRLVERRINLNSRSSDLCRTSLTYLDHDCGALRPCELCVDLNRHRWIAPPPPGRYSGCKRGG